LDQQEAQVERENVDQEDQQVLLGQLVPKVPLDLKVVEVLKDPKGQLDHKDFLDQLEVQDLQDLKDQQDQQDQTEQTDQPDLLDQLDHVDPKEILVAVETQENHQTKFWFWITADVWVRLQEASSSSFLSTFQPQLYRVLLYSSLD